MSRQEHVRELTIERYSDMNGAMAFRLLDGDREIARREIGFMPTDDDIRALRNARMYWEHRDRALVLGDMAAAETEFSLACEQIFGERVRPWLPR